MHTLNWENLLLHLHQTKARCVPEKEKSLLKFWVVFACGFIKLSDMYIMRNSDIVCLCYLMYFLNRENMLLYYPLIIARCVLYNLESFIKFSKLFVHDV